MKKYKTYTELAEAFKTGELDKNKYMLSLDNDDCFLSFNDESLSEEENDRLQEEALELFKGYGYSDLKEICDAAGIPADWV